MYKFKLLFVICISVIIFFNNINTMASESLSKYILVYDHLYKYAENTSDVLRQFMKLKSAGQDVSLLHVDKIDINKLEKDSIILIVASSFDSEEDFQYLLEFKKLQIKIINNNNFVVANESIKKPSIIIAIDKVYPFSDFNKVMDLAEILYGRGIDFIVTVMPVYDNYHLEAFDTYISVLNYLSKRGGHLFIHYPIGNQDGTYNMNPEAGLKQSLNEYQKRGLNILGLTISQESLFTAAKIFKDIDLPYILVTESESKIISKNIDLFDISQILNNYILIEGIDINHFNLFSFVEKEYSTNKQSICISIADKQDKLLSLLRIFNNQQINIADFKISPEKYMEFNHFQNKSLNITEVDKSELELFKEEEFKKIKGENLKVQQAVNAYSISWFVKIGIKTVFLIIILLLIQILIGRRFDIKKFFKD